MSWPALLIGPALVTLLFFGWLGVQRFWSRIFELPENADALEGRESCANCTCSKAHFTENTHDR